MAFWPKKPDGAATTPANGATAQAPASSSGLASKITPIAAGQPNDPTLPPVPTAPGAAPPAAQPLTDEQKKDAAMASKLMMAAFGEITSVLLRAKDYRNKPLASLEELAVPAVLSGQFSLAQAQSAANGMTAAVGVVFWARVSDEVDKRFSENIVQPINSRPPNGAAGLLYGSLMQSASKR